MTEETPALRAQTLPSEAPGPAERALQHPSAPNPELDELVAVLARLRAPGGCAWDREQTHESLVVHLIEETYELVDAIEAGDRDGMLEELGDVLYQVIFHSDIAAHDPSEGFDLGDVASHMTAKMVGRHPHVFADAEAGTAIEVEALWDDLKKTEKPSRTSVLDGIPSHLPSLQLASKLISRAAKVGVTVETRADVTPRDTPDGGDAPVGLYPDPAVDEARLGAELLALVAEGSARGLDAERALRNTLRSLREDIESAEAHRSADH